MNDAVPRRHRVAAETIEQLFAGPVDTAAMAVLRDGQHSRRLLLLKIMRELAISTPVAGLDRHTVEDTWRVLVAAEKRAPQTVRYLLSYPSVGTWLVRVIRRLRQIVDDHEVPLWVDVHYLHSIAAASAVRAGIDAVVAVPVWRGRVTLPTVGQYVVAEADSARVARVRVLDSVPFSSRERERGFRSGIFRSFRCTCIAALRMGVP